MALARVQTTGKTSADNVTGLVLTFASPPTVGNAIVVPVVLWRSGAAPAGATVVDSWGNVYTLAVTQVNVATRVSVYYCPRILVSATPFRITITPSAQAYVLASAVEISGVVPGLTVDQTISAAATTTTPTTGSTAALTGTDAVLVAVLGMPTTQTSITVASVAPAWTQEYEELSGSHIPGEADTRIVTGVSGTTQACSWTNTASSACATALVAFKIGTVTAAIRATQTAVEVLGATVSTAVTAVRVTQAPVELLNQTAVPVRVTQAVIEVLWGLGHWKLLIDGIDRTARVQACSMTWTLNERARMTVTFDAYLPDRLAEVMMYARNGLTPLFGGVILQRQFTGYSQAQPDYKVTCECGDFFTYLDWRTADTTYAEASLKTMLTAIVATYLADFGITLDPVQADGPTVAPLTWSGVRIADGLRELSDQTGWIVKMTPGKVLSMGPPATEPAPFVWSDSSSPSHVLDVDWRDNDVIPVNKIVLVCGPNGLVTIADERHYGDGVRRIFPLNSPFVQIIGGLSIGGEPGGYGVGTYGIDDLPYTYDASLNAIRQRADQPVLLAGHYLWVWYEAQFPFVVEATTGATPVIEHREARPELLSIPAAQAIADAMLEDLGADPIELHGTTDEDGYEVGQLLTLDLADMRHLEGPYTIKSVQIDLVLDAYWRNTIEATAGLTRPRATAVAQWRDMMGQGRAIPGAWDRSPPALTTEFGPSPSTLVKAGGTSPSPIVTAGVAASLGGPAFLGGARTGIAQQDPAVWTPVSDYVAYHAGVSFTGFVRCDLSCEKADVSAQARFWNLTDSRAAGVSPVVRSQVPVSTLFGVTIEFGKRYRLEVIVDARTTAHCIGTLEST